MKDWEVNPDDYLKDKEDNFVLKVDGTPKKRGGRKKGTKSRGYNYTRANQARMAANKSVREKEKLIAKAEAKLKNQKNSLKTSKSTLAKIDNNEISTQGKVVTEDNIVNLPKRVKEEALENVIFKPNEGPQTDFLAAPETDVLYGGAAGGGKSYAMLVSGTSI